MNGGVHIAEEDLALYGMGSLQGEELAMVRAHLQSCAECREELDRISADLSVLGMSVDQHSAPAPARSRLLDSIQRDVESGTATHSGSVTQLPARGSRPVWIPWTIAAALAVGATGLGVKVNNLQHRLREQSQRLAESREAAVRSQRVIALLKTPQAQRVTLTAAKAPPAVPTGHAIYLAERGELIFQGSHLKSLPEDKAYELWVIPQDGTAAIPAGVFRPDNAGEASVVMPPLPTGVPAKAFAITVERAGGVPKAEGPIVLSGGTTAGG